MSIGTIGTWVTLMGFATHPKQNILLESGSQDKDIRQSTCKLFFHQKARGILGRGPSYSSSIPAIAVTQISDQEAGYPWGLLLGLHWFLVTLSGLSDLLEVARIVGFTGFTTLRGYCKPHMRQRRLQNGRWNGAWTGWWKQAAKWANDLVKGQMRTRDCLIPGSRY